MELPPRADEATLVLATVMASFKIALAPGQTVGRIMLRPHDSLLLVVQPRGPSS